MQIVFCAVFSSAIPPEAPEKTAARTARHLGERSMKASASSTSKPRMLPSFGSFLALIGVKLCKCAGVCNALQNRGGPSLDFLQSRFEGDDLTLDLKVIEDWTKSSFLSGGFET